MANKRARHALWSVGRGRFHTFQIADWIDVSSFLSKVCAEAGAYITDNQNKAAVFTHFEHFVRPGLALLASSFLVFVSSGFGGLRVAQAFKQGCPRGRLRWGAWQVFHLGRAWMGFVGSMPGWFAQGLPGGWGAASMQALGRMVFPVFSHIGNDSCCIAVVPPFYGIGFPLNLQRRSRKRKKV